MKICSRCTIAQVALDPNVRTLSPGSMQPIESQAAGPSTVPLITGVPSRRPVCSAASGVIRPTTSSHPLMSGSLLRSTPSLRSMSSSQSFRRMS